MTKPTTAIPTFMFAKIYRFRADDGSTINFKASELYYLARHGRISANKEHGILLISPEEQQRLLSEPFTFNRRKGRIVLST